MEVMFLAEVQVMPSLELCSSRIESEPMATSSNTLSSVTSLIGAGCPIQINLACCVTSIKTNKLNEKQNKNKLKLICLQSFCEPLYIISCTYPHFDINLTRNSFSLPYSLLHIMPIDSYQLHHLVS